MVTAAEAAQLRTAQAGIRALVERDLTAFIESLDVNRPEQARDQLLEFVPVLVAEYGEQAAGLAADWYDEMRDAEGVPGVFRAEMQPSPYQDSVEPAVRRAAGGLFVEDATATLVSLKSTAPKYVLAAGRSTIATATARDPRASGWQRVTRARACRFCRALAQRGAVYKESTAFFASHGDCNCAAVPSWDQDAPEVDAFAYDASVRMSGLRRAAANGSADARRRIEEHNDSIRWLIDRYGD